MEGRVPRYPKSANSLVCESLDRSNFWIFIPGTDYFGVVPDENKLPYLCRADRSSKLQFSYWNGSDRWRISVIAAPLAPSISCVHWVGYTLAWALTMVTNCDGYRSNDLSPIWLPLDPLGSLDRG